MFGNKADAATSTDDIKGRPLCLFYFTHPFGVLSPDPPTVAAAPAPADIAHAFINMEPAPDFWSRTSSADYETTTSSTAHASSRKPLNIIAYGVSEKSSARYPEGYVRRDSVSSSLFSSDPTEPMWCFPSSSRREHKRLQLPYTLPPLELPLRELECSETTTFWEAKRPMQKLSLPPIELPEKRDKVRSVRRKVEEAVARVSSGEAAGVRGARGRGAARVGVRKSRRARRSGLRRMVTNLIQRVTRGREKELRGSPAIQEVLTTIREAWIEPKSLRDRSRTVTSADTIEHAAILDPAAILPPATMPGSRQPLADALTPRPGASPGLMRRRYSMPETIMRKYRLAQLRSDSEESEPATAPSRAASPASLASPARSCASLCEPPTHRFMRRDRELMRKSALLRRLWGGRPSGSSNELAPCPSCSCDVRYCSDRDLYDSHTEYGRESRSLDGSRAELGASGSSRSRARDSHPPLSGWATPKRQRLDSPGGLNSSDEMLRAAMRNSYDRAAEIRHESERREEPPSSDSTFQSHGRDPSSGDVSRFTETPESAEADKPRKKRRQSVCIYMNSLESPTAEIKSETATDTPETAESYTTPRTGEQTSTTNSTFVTSEISSTNVYSETTSTAPFDSVSTNDVQYRDSLEGQTEESSNDNNSENLNKCVVEVQEDSKEEPLANDKERSGNTLSKITDSIVEILEIVVSETLNSSAFEDNKDVPAIKNDMNSKKALKVPESLNKIPSIKHPMDLDQYVSNILVESLNSLTDQIEGMNASMGGDRKISIVEKEIKVKLQNTGMNTIVHLSPNSNNPIIFGNEELYDKQDIVDTKNSSTCYEDKSNISADTVKIELMENNDFRLTDSSDNITHVNAKELRNENDAESMMMMSNEHINKTVLQQIQKLFQDGLQQFDPNLNYPGRMVPEISHIEISNVDVFINDNSDPNYERNDMIEINTDRNSCQFDCSLEDGHTSSTDVLGEVGTGTYFKEPTGPVLVPRFSAFPNTDSMEVNTSSDENEAIGSDCTSLVDSLDDPNSPRNILLRRSYSNKRSELVRSAIDVLDLLPEMSQDYKSHAEKSEAFFIRIRDNDCDCEKENIVVADHMPDQIKQRLYRRHRKRELRMEYAKRKKVRQIKREIEKQRQPESVKSKKEIEKDCKVILDSLIEEVIAKIAEQEHKYMRIKQQSHNGSKRSDHSMSSTGNDKVKSHHKSSELSNMESFKVGKHGEVNFCNKSNIEKDQKPKSKLNGHDHYHRITGKSQIRGKLSLRPHSPPALDSYGPKRIYQKSEIHDGSKCIEILEILEYVESSQSSPETTNSDENKNHKNSKYRKSRIPIPIYERIHRLPRVKNIQKPYKNAHLVRSSPNLKYEKVTNYKMDNFIADILIDAINDNETDSELTTTDSIKSIQAPTRRASVPQQDTHRSRSTNSLRFKQIFDIIPEEKSSLSVESSNEDINLNRRVSVPILASKYSESNNNETVKRKDKPKDNGMGLTNKISKLSKCTSTSPPLAEDSKSKTRSATTSPLSKMASAATSPIVVQKSLENGNDHDKIKDEVKVSGSAKKSLSSHGTRDGWVGFYKPNKQLTEEEGVTDSKEVKAHAVSKTRNSLKSTHTQYDNPKTQSTVRTIESEKTKQIIINHDKIRTSSEKSQTIEPDNQIDETRKHSSNSKDVKRKKERNFLDKLKDKDTKSRRESRMVHSQSDPQTRTDFVIKKTDRKKIQMISVEKSEEDTMHSKSLKFPDAYKDKQANQSSDVSSDSDSDSGKSLLCSLAPKWLSMGSGARQKRQVRKKASQEQQNAAGGWSVTVAGNSYTALPADVEMRLSFPKPSAHHVTSQSDSGFGEDNKTRRPLAATRLRESSCKCRHCEDCTCSRVRSLEQDSSCSPFLPPAHNRKMTLMMKKESTGSSILATKNMKKQNESLPEVEWNKNKSKNSVKSRRLSLHCWLPEDDRTGRPRPRATEALAVLGCAIIPEAKPRVPTMSERDLTRVYTPRHYLRS